MRFACMCLNLYSNCVRVCVYVRVQTHTYAHAVIFPSCLLSMFYQSKLK